MVKANGSRDTIIAAGAVFVLLLVYMRYTSMQHERDIQKLSIQMRELYSRLGALQEHVRASHDQINSNVMASHSTLQESVRAHHSQLAGAMQQQQAAIMQQQQFAQPAAAAAMPVQLDSSNGMPAFQQQPQAVTLPKYTAPNGHKPTTQNDLNLQEDRSALQNIYEIYHSQRGDTCTGCAYVKPILSAIQFSSVLDAGAANCKVTRAFRDAGKAVKAVELSTYAINTFCPDLIQDGTAFNAAVHELDMFSDGQFDFVFCADVLEHVPEANVEQTIHQFTRVGTNYYFFVIHDAPAQKDKKSLTKDSKYKIHETVQPRSWWLSQFARYGVHENPQFKQAFLKAAKSSMPKELLTDKQLSRMYFMSKQ